MSIIHLPSPTCFPCWYLFNTAFNNLHNWHNWIIWLHLNQNFSLIISWLVRHAFSSPPLSLMCYTLSPLFSYVRQKRSSYFTVPMVALFPPLLLLLLLLSLLLLKMFLNTKISPSSTPTVLRQTVRHIFILFRFCACNTDSLYQHQGVGNQFCKTISLLILFVSLLSQVTSSPLQYSGAL